MILFKKVRYKNFLSTGQQFIEIDLDKDKLKNMIKETFVEAQDTDVTSDNI